MSTPRKDFNYASPYAKPVQQYPSQSEEFISFSVSGQFQPELDRSSVQLRYPNGSNRQRRGNSSSFSNPESYNSRGSYGTHKQWDTPRKPGGYYRNRINKEKHEQPSISSYLHPSMTEDPWQEFMIRIDAINNSSISLKSKLDKDNNSKSTKTEDSVIEEDVA